MKGDAQWHLDKKVPLGLLVMIIIQTVVLAVIGITWKSGVDNRLTNLEKFETTVSISRPVTLQRLTILEQQYLFIQSTLIRIENNQSKNLETILKESKNEVK